MRYCVGRRPPRWGCSLRWGNSDWTNDSLARVSGGPSSLVHDSNLSLTASAARLTEADVRELPEQVTHVGPRLQLILVVTLCGVELLHIRQKGEHVEGVPHDAEEPATIVRGIVRHYRLCQPHLFSCWSGNVRKNETLDMLRDVHLRCVCRIFQ